MITPSAKTVSFMGLLLMPLLVAPAVFAQDAAVQLPEVQVPATNLPQPAVAEAPAAASDATAASTTTATSVATASVEATAAEPAAAPEEKKEKNFIASYGTYKTSVFFTKSEIKNMKRVLYISESFQGKEVTDKPKTEDTALNALLDNLNIQQPTVDVTPLTEFPKFYISTIVYKSPGNWAMWMNGARVTPKLLPTDIEVLGVSQNAVRFLWKPEKFMQFKEHWEGLAKGTVGSVPPRKASQFAKVTLNEEKSGWEFTVHPNQAFSSQYMAVVEGNPDQAVLAAEAVPPEPVAQPEIPAILGDPDAKLRQTSEELQRQNKQLSGIGRPRTDAETQQIKDAEIKQPKATNSGLVTDVQPAPPPVAQPAQTPAEAVNALLGALTKATAAAGGEEAGAPVGLPVLPSQ